nr:antibiotic biosynthesis monooxygenase [Streptomyces sp. SID3343]
MNVRFTARDEAAVRAFDALVAETLIGIRELEPGTLIYVSHAVDGKPLQRIFYELYADRAAFDLHEQQPHVRRFLAAREQYIESVAVDFLESGDGKGIPEEEARGV